MAVVDAQDGSEDVTDFLRRIKELGDKRDREDEARTRKLEEDILESRRQREARRVERARSLSPEKQSPSNTPRSMRSPRNLPGSRDITNTSSRTTFSPVRSTPLPVTDDTPVKAEPENPASPDQSSFVHEDQSFTTSEHATDGAQASANGLRRTNTLSWQQRPTSKNGPRSRPVSTVQTRSPTRATPEPATVGNNEDAAASRSQIAERLADKDPTWFRQTADRGKGSPAYLRSQDEDSKSPQSTVGRRRLHGMFPEPEARSSPAAPVPNSFSPARSPSPPSMRVEVSPQEPTVQPVLSKTSSTMPPPPRFKPSDGHESPTNNEVTSLFKPQSPSRTQQYTERSASPTKGMGGFVQSAMLRRTESVNKRWSAQTAAGLSRQNSNSGFGRRPSSRENNMPTDSLSKPPETSGVTLSDAKTPEFHPSPGGRDASPQRSELKDQGSDHGISQIAAEPTTEQVSPPSPAKRWSPLKSSWLESALTKPDSPKTSSQPLQPAWLSDLNKSKQQKGSDAMGTTSRNRDTQVTKTLPQSPDLPSSTPSEVKNSFTTQETFKAPPSTETTASSVRSLSSADVRKAEKSPALIAKPKPITPPKKDFRSTLKPRQDSPSKQSEENPEFLNAFGKLKRAKTANYVAPDELKNNILRGKAGLAVTDGPQPSQKKDEFKESLLERKATMKAKAADPPSKTDKPREELIPEALAKRKALGHASANRIEPKPETLKVGNVREDLPVAEKEVFQPLQQTVSEPITSKSAILPGGKLAGKFNPALANIIARGPIANNPPPLIEARHASAGADSVAAPSQAIPTSPTPLDHMTKSRARGPKRRAPKTVATTSMEEPRSPVLTSKPKPMPKSSSRNVTPTKPAFSNANASSFPKDPPKEPMRTPQTRSANHSISPIIPRASTEPGKPDQKPNMPLNVTSPKVAKPSNLTRSGLAPLIDSGAEKKTQAQLQDDHAGPSVRNASARWGRAAASEPSAQPMKEPIRLPTRKDEAAANEHVGLGRGLISNGSAKLPDTEDTNTKEPKQSQLVASASKAAPGRVTSPSTLPKPAIANGITKVNSSSNGITADLPSRPSNKAGKALVDFFGAPIVTPSDLTIDVDDILSAAKPQTSSKIKTLRKQIQTMNSDGKTAALPANQEHVLYGKNTYLCTHVFGDSTGARKTEVYLWSGNQVAGSAIEDAQLFARRAAKDAGGTLHAFKQGQEPSNFFQALGGIVITRRTGSSGPFMLCGRGHLGHVAFDEVDLSLESFCSGFPYIIAAQTATRSEGARPSSSSSNSNAKLYLWKGASCNAEELGCARLVSMDMDPTATIIEVDEGSEPTDLLSVFGASKSTTLPRSADHWKHKPECSNYYTRLFRISHTDPASSTSRPSSSHLATATATTSALWNALSRRGSQPSSASQSQQQIMELAPYTQSDLYASSIYVLDAFFTLYILLGPDATNQRDAFATAMAFAQEYAILAAGKEERPGVPEGVVVLPGGVPREVRACFRGWDGRMGLFGKGDRGEVVEVGLAEAVEASRIG